MLPLLPEVQQHPAMCGAQLCIPSCSSPTGSHRNESRKERRDHTGWLQSWVGHQASAEGSVMPCV